MRNVLLISEDTLRSNSELSDNIWGKNVLPAIRTSQDIALQGFIGSCLYEKLLDLVADGSIQDQENVAYKDLLDDFVQPFLIEQVLADITPIVESKLANLGVYKSRTDYADNVPASEVERFQYRHIVNADFYAKRMQNFLKAHRDAYPELDCCGCGADIKPNLESAEEVSIFLGGNRGRIIR